MTDWSWSCVHDFVEAYGADWLADLQREYPLLEFGKGWDDFRSFDHRRS
jgi:hypothetical protein